MSFRVEVTEYFERRANPLSKRYPSLKSDLHDLIESLAQTPEQGIHLGNSVFKIRLKISSKGKGKSGGARVITLVIQAEEVVKLITIYDKSDLESINYQSIQIILESLNG